MKNSLVLSITKPERKEMMGNTGKIVEKERVCNACALST